MVEEEQNKIKVQSSRYYVQHIHQNTAKSSPANESEFKRKKPLKPLNVHFLFQKEVAHEMEKMRCSAESMTVLGAKRI